MGGMMGSLLGGGGGSSGSGSRTSTGAGQHHCRPAAQRAHRPGNQKDLRQIEKLLKIIDQPFSRSRSSPTPRRGHPGLQPECDDIAATVASFMRGGWRPNGSAQQRQPNPQDLLLAMRGRAPNQNKKGKSQDDPQRRCPLQLAYRRRTGLPVREVRELVHQLDTSVVKSRK